MRKGDEIMMINHVKVQDLDLQTFNDHLNRIPLVLVLRSARLISERLNLLSAREVINRQNSKRAQSLSLVRKSTVDSSPPVGSTVNLTLPLPKNSFTSEQRIEKVTAEFMESERAYVRVSQSKPRARRSCHRPSLQDLECLLKQYIEPLRSHSSLGLPSDVIESLSQSVQSIHRFQFAFLQRLPVNQSSEVRICLLPLQVSSVDRSIDVLGFPSITGRDLHSCGEKLQTLLHLLCTSSTSESFIRPSAEQRGCKRVSLGLQSQWTTCLILRVLSDQTCSTSGQVSSVSPADAQLLEERRHESIGFLEKSEQNDA